MTCFKRTPLDAVWVLDQKGQEWTPVRRLFSKQETMVYLTRMGAVGSEMGHTETDFESRAGKIFNGLDVGCEKGRVKIMPTFLLELLVNRGIIYLP